MGAGTFGIPYVMTQSGFGLGFFYLALIFFAVLSVHLFYGEIILRTDQPHRLVGYAEKYLGNGVKKIVTFTILIEYYGALLVYLILGGEFLKIIFGRWFGGSEFIWVIIFFLLGTAAILCRLKTIARSEFFMTLLLLATVAVLLIKGAPLINFHYFRGIDLKNFFLPYGVILFAMAGAAAIPEMRQILKGQERKLKTAIFWGTLIPAVVYLLFAFVVVGVTGSQTTTDAISGLVPRLGEWVVGLGAVFGILAVVTSYIVLGLSLKNIFNQDYKIAGSVSYLLVCLVPLIAYFLGLNNFILIIGLVGAVASGLDGILTVLIYRRAKKLGGRQPEYSLKYFKILGSFLIAIFALGLIYQLVYLVVK